MPSSEDGQEAPVSEKRLRRREAGGECGSHLVIVAADRVLRVLQAVRGGVDDGDRDGEEHARRVVRSGRRPAKISSLACGRPGGHVRVGRKPLLAKPGSGERRAGQRQVKEEACKRAQEVRGAGSSSLSRSPPSPATPQSSPVERRTFRAAQPVFVRLRARGGELRHLVAIDKRGARQ